MAKLPKSLGACVDLYHDLRDKRLELQKEVDAVKADETIIMNHIIDNLSKQDEGGAVGKRYKGIIKTEQVPQVEDWGAFYAHIKKTGGFDMLNRALNRAAVNERLSTGKAVPGVKTFTAVKLSVTKVS